MISRPATVIGVDNNFKGSTMAGVVTSQHGYDRKGKVRSGDVHWDQQRFKYKAI